MKFLSAVCAHSPAIKSPSVGAVIVNSDGRPQRRSLSSSSSDSSSIDEPLTPSDHEAFSIGILSAAPCSLPLTLHEKRKGSTLEQIFIPTCPPVPGISIEESPEFAFENLLPASQTFGWWLLPEPQDTEAARPEFVVLEAFPTSQFRQLSLAHDLRLVNEPITIRATIPFSNSLTEQHRNFLRFSSFLGSKAVRAMASRVLAIDILLPHGYTGAWATDLDRLTETFDTSNPNLTFPNLVSFKWQGARMAKHGLPAPYYDFNALPLAQLREVIVKGTPISIVDAYHLLDVCSALEEVELTIMKDRFLLDDSALTLECPQLRSLRISSYADLAHFFCLLDAPSLREVVYTPLGDALTIYTFPWNAIVPSLRRFVLVGSENIDPEVCDILEEACEGDDVQLQVLLYAEDISLL